MALEVELVGGKKTWRFERGPIGIGRDPSNAIELPAAEFPGVSREHALLQLEGGPLRVEDRHSGNGTFLNGVRITVAELASGDVLRLGPEGPELMVSVPGAQRATVLGAPAATLAAGRQSAATRMAPAASSSATMAAPAAYAPPAASTIMAPGGGASDSGEGARSPARREARRAAPPGAGAQRAAEEGAAGAERGAGPEQFAALEAGIAALRRLSLSLVVLVAALFGLIAYQNSEIGANREALDRMHAEARSAVGAFTPELDQRLRNFDTRMDAMDGKIQATEDHFVARLNQDLPALLDRYISQKLALVGVKR